MKILNCYAKIFWLLLFSSYLGMYCSDELSQEADTDESDEATWIDSDEDQELKVLPIQSIEDEEGQEIKVGLTLDMPGIGKVTLYPEKDPTTGENILKATLPGRSINLSPVPIYFDNFELVIPDNRNPSINATVTIFGKRAKLELIEIKKETALKEIPIKTKEGKIVDALDLDISLLQFRILFDEKPSFTFFPEKSIDLNHIDLFVEKGKLPWLGTEINIFGQPVKLQFGFTKESAKIDFSLQNTQFSNIIPFIENTPLADANLKSVIISAKYQFAKTDGKEKPTELESAASNSSAEKDSEEELKKAAESTNIGSPSNLSLAISAQADFSKIAGSLPISLQNLNINARYSQSEGFHLDSDIKNFGVPGIGTIAKAQLIINWSEGGSASEEVDKELDKEKETEAIEKPLQIEGSTTSETTDTSSEEKNKSKRLTISIIGSGVLSIPISGFGQLKYDLNARYVDKEFNFGGKINESFSYASIDIASEALFTANITKQSINIIGNTSINGLDLIAKFAITPDEKTKETVVSVTATAKTTNWQPFVQLNKLNLVDFPSVLEDLTITNLDAAFDISKITNKNITSNLIIKGQANILNIDVDAQVSFIKNDKQTGVFLKASVPEDKLPSAIKAINIKDAFFVLSTIAYIDPVTKTQYAKGLNLAGEFDFTGDLKPLGDILHIEHLNIVGTVDPSDIRKSKFSIQLPGIIDTGIDVVSFGPLSLEVSALPSIELVTEVTVRPDKDQSLVFKGGGGVTGASLAMKLDMIGLWRNPFNLISDGFAIGNGHLGFSLITVPPYLNGLSIAGETELSKTQDIKFALSIDLINPTNIALLGQLDGRLTLEDFIKFIVCEVMHQNMDNLAAVPEVAMQDIKISFAPVASVIGQFNIEQGVTLKGIVNLFGQTVAVDFAVVKTGAKAKAAMTPITLGPLKITSGEMITGEKRNTSLGGPEIDIELSMARQQFLITGMLDIEDIFSISSDINISRSGIDFNFNTFIGPRDSKLFMASVKGFSSGPLSDPDFNLTIEMQQKFIDTIKDQIIDALKIAQVKVHEKIDTAVSNINKVDKQVKEAQDDIDKARDAVKDWASKVISIDKQIAAKKKELDSYKSKITGGSIWGDIGDTFKDAGNAIGDLAKDFVGALGEFSEQAIDEAKSLVKKGIDEAERQADKVVFAAKIIELGVEIGALEAYKGSIQVSAKAAEGFLDKVVKNLTQAGWDASKSASKGVLTGFEKAAVATLKAGEWTVRSLAEGFNVKRAVFDGSLQKIEKGELPSMLFEITILGSDRTIKFDFNFKDIAKSAADLAQDIVDKFIPGI